MCLPGSGRPWAAAIRGPPLQNLWEAIPQKQRFRAVENEFGVLSRVCGPFSGRGFNIDSLSWHPPTTRRSPDYPGYPRGRLILEQITKSSQLIDRHQGHRFHDGRAIEREWPGQGYRGRQSRAEVLRISDISGQRSLMSHTLLPIEATDLRQDRRPPRTAPSARLKELSGPGQWPSPGAKGWKGNRYRLRIVALPGGCKIDR